MYTFTCTGKGFGKGFAIPSTVGVKQEDNLAPVLFILSLIEVDTALTDLAASFDFEGA